MNTNAQVVLLVPMNPVPGIVQPTTVFSVLPETLSPNNFYQPLPMMQPIMMPQVMSMAPQYIPNNPMMPQTAYPLQMMVPGQPSPNNMYQVVPPPMLQQPVMVTQTMPMNSQMNSCRFNESDGIVKESENTTNCSSVRESKKDADGNPESNVNNGVKRICSGAVGYWNSNTSYSTNDISRSNSDYTSITSNDSTGLSDSSTSKSDQSPIDSDDVSVYQEPKEHYSGSKNVDRGIQTFPLVKNQATNSILGPRKFPNMFANTNSPIDSQREKPSAFKDVYLAKPKKSKNQKTKQVLKKWDRIQKLKKIVEATSTSVTSQSENGNKENKRKQKKVLPPLRIELISKPHILKPAPSEPTPFQNTKDVLTQTFQNYATGFLPSCSDTPKINLKRNLSRRSDSQTPVQEGELCNSHTRKYYDKRVSYSRETSGATTASSSTFKKSTSQPKTVQQKTIRFSDKTDQQKQQRIGAEQLKENDLGKQNDQDHQQNEEFQTNSRNKSFQYINVLSQEIKNDNDNQASTYPQSKSGCRCCRKLSKETKRALELKEALPKSQIDEIKKDYTSIPGTTISPIEKRPCTSKRKRILPAKSEETTTNDETYSESENDAPRQKRRRVFSKKKPKCHRNSPELPITRIVRRKPKTTCYECRASCTCANLSSSSECLAKCHKKEMTKEICKRCPGLLTYQEKPRLSVGLLRNPQCTFQPCYNAACGLSGHWDCCSHQNKCPDCDCCCCNQSCCC